MGIWFQPKRGRVIGITAMGNNFGGFVMPPLLGFILPVLMWQGPMPCSHSCPERSYCRS